MWVLRVLRQKKVVSQDDGQTSPKNEKTECCCGWSPRISPVERNMGAHTAHLGSNSISLLSDQDTLYVYTVSATSHWPELGCVAEERPREFWDQRRNRGKTRSAPPPTCPFLLSRVSRDNYGLTSHALTLRSSASRIRLLSGKQPRLPRTFC